MDNLIVLHVCQMPPSNECVGNCIFCVFLPAENQKSNRPNLAARREGYFNGSGRLLTFIFWQAFASAVAVLVAHKIKRDKRNR